MKEYDIFLQKQPEGEIIIYMLAYYVNLSVRNGLLINAGLYEKAIKKIYAENCLEIQAKISKINKHIFERIQTQIGIAASSNFSAKKFVDSVGPDIIHIKTPEINVTPVELLSGANNDIEISQTLLELKYGAESVFDEFQVSADVSEIKKRDFEQYNDGILPVCRVDGIFYRDIYFNGTSSVELDASAGMALKRYRLLTELDNNSMADSQIPLSDSGGSGGVLSVDSMTLEELDYVTLEA